jgi:hypothetical protein
MAVFTGKKSAPRVHKLNADGSEPRRQSGDDTFVAALRDLMAPKVVVAYSVLLLASFGTFSALFKTVL